MKIGLDQHIPKIAWILTRWICASLRIKITGRGKICELMDKDERIIYVFWHGRHFMLYHLIPPKNIHILVSPSRDGRLVADLLRFSKFNIIHGSSHKSPVRALMQSVRQIKKGGDIAISVDGPKGPALVAKPGAVFVAKKTNAFIVPMTWAVKKGIQLKSWDRFLVPLPFHQTIVIYGEPYQIDSKTDQESIASDCRDLEKRLTAVTNQADAWVAKR